jgi:hypothetical protein
MSDSAAHQEVEDRRSWEGVARDALGAPIARPIGGADAKRDAARDAPLVRGGRRDPRTPPSKETVEIR